MSSKVKYNRIKDVLKERGMTQTFLSKKSGKKFQSINNYVNNRSQPTIQTLFRLAAIIGVPPHELIAGYESTKKNEGE